MNERLIDEVVGEVTPALAGRPWGKVFQLSPASLAVDFRTGDGRYLLLSAEPNQPRLHTIARTVRELERDASPPSPFALVLRKRLGGATLVSVSKDAGERVVRFDFDVPDATGEGRGATLVAQLTGRTSNLFLLDEGGRVVDSLRPARGEGQEAGDVYGPPARANAAAPTTPRKEFAVEREPSESLSDALDRHYKRLDEERAFASRASAASSRLKQEAEKLRKLRANLSRDLVEHGDAEAHKRAGDLLLANIGTAVRSGATVRLMDFYADGTPFVELEIEEGRSLQEEAAARFSRYTKAKRAAREISERLAAIDSELERLEERRAALESIIAARDSAALAEFTGDGGRAAEDKSKAKRKPAKKAADDALRGIRRYRSSDGYEILVGRGPRENDRLTFRVARSFDAWLHAADYPGSHVVVRARGRDEAVPHRTLVEAAQLAAHFSKAGKDSKVAVNHTLRKFVTKPKGAAPGLVYLSSFRTVLVEPAEALERL